MATTYPFCANYDKRGMAKCKTCKEKFEKGSFRLGKIKNKPSYSNVWYHVNCLFQSFKKAPTTTRKIKDPEQDVENWNQVEAEDKEKVMRLVEDLQSFLKVKAAPRKNPKKPKANPVIPPSTSKPGDGNNSEVLVAERPNHLADCSHKDNSFQEFQRLCANLAAEPKYLGKTQLVSNFFTYGTGKDKFKGDLRLWLRFLLPGEMKRVYNLQSKQLLKLFSQIFNTNLEDMLQDLEQGDVAETVCKFFEASKQLPPTKKSTLSLQDVDGMLEDLNGKTREEDQLLTLRDIAKRSTTSDLKMVLRLIKGDLRINAGPKHILSGLHSDAYEAFQTTQDIDDVLDKIISGKVHELQMTVVLLTPVKPMLAQACKSVDTAFNKCTSGVMFAEIKYDGERVQLHKKGSEFRFFSRSLKPVKFHKIQHLEQHIPKAFPGASDLILDAEVLMICTKTGKLLPCGTLGIHKKAAFADACPCLFVFDCMHYNGEDLMSKPICERRAMLENTMVEVQNHVMVSKMEKIKGPEELKHMIAKVLKQGMEGLVLKDSQSIYEPGKRHWLKVKKDYLNNGAMADTADLVVLGAWYGTGKKGGKMSVFLMGCYDECINKWCTVTKVHSGHDDAALERLQTELHMVKINQDAAHTPVWLKVNRALVPDFVAVDPKNSPVWEITGAEFTRNQVHTADGISIRFPRVTRERNDKDWMTATSLTQLQHLYRASKEYKDIDSLLGVTGKSTDAGGIDEETSQLPSPSYVSSPSLSSMSSAQKKDADDMKEMSEREEKTEKKRKKPQEERKDEEKKKKKSPKKKLQHDNTEELPI